MDHTLDVRTVMARVRKLILCNEGEEKMLLEKSNALSVTAKPGSKPYSAFALFPFICIGIWIVVC